MTTNNESLQCAIGYHKYNIKGGLIISFIFLTFSVGAGIGLYNEVNDESIDLLSMFKAIGLFCVMAIFLFITISLLKDVWDDYCQLKLKRGEDIYLIKFKIGITVILTLAIWYCINSLALIWNDALPKPLLQFSLTPLFSFGILAAIFTVVREWLHKPKKNK